GSYSGEIMKTIFLMFAMVVSTAAVAVSQTPRPTPAPRPAATPAPGPRPTPTQAVANTPVPQSRIALIDTTMFGDEKNGIYRYLDAAKSVQAEFKTRSDEVQNLENRLSALVNEIQALSKAPVVDQKTIQAKQQQGVTLQTE